MHITEAPDGAGLPLHDHQVQLRRLSGATASRVVDGRACVVDEHAHDWPVLSIFIAGEYRNRSDLGEVSISSPAVLLYRRGDAHANRVGHVGHEQIEIEFDPLWVSGSFDLDRPEVWIGGPTATAARRLASLWRDPRQDEVTLSAATGCFLRAAIATKPRHRPWWVDQALAALSEEDPPTTEVLARRLGLSGAWLAHAYRTSIGEGVSDTVTRRRVERASVLLRTTSLGAADIAAAVGFCDQSHMIHGFRKVLSRTPAELRKLWLSRRASNIEPTPMFNRGPVVDPRVVDVVDEQSRR